MSLAGSDELADAALDYDGPIFDDPPAAETESEAPVPAQPEPSVPADRPHPDDDRPLADLAQGDPIEERRLREEATSIQHLMTHYPKNPYCRLCNIAKNTAMRIARQRDGRADDLVDPWLLMMSS